MIGLDISDHSIKLVQLTRSRPHRLLAHCWHPIPDGVMTKGVIVNDKGLRQALVEIFARCRISPRVRDAMVVSIPETQSFLRVVEIPVMAEDEVDEAVQWEVAQHIPFGLENVYIDWQPLTTSHSATPGRMEVLVGAAQKQVIDPLYAALHQLKVDVAAFELESQAIVRSLISTELRQRQGLLIIDLGASATNVVIHDHGTIRFTASLQRGTKQFLSVLAPQQQAGIEGPPHELGADLAGIGQQLQPAYEGLVQEIRGIVEFYNSIDAQHEVREIVLTGGGSNLPQLDAVFPKYFDNVLVQRGNPWLAILPPGKAKQPPMTLQESVHFTTALGLALRTVLV
jgi:type IV pilus assembly protein PilM